ncbi:Zinc finger CCHC domain-containing protein 3 [Holothuria leucospilota]|uniref:Zinc finger CCHC domain-containing protein 3 n=1 Tax=Holothuria leucospilota TaxID=206669 RepID=A0A9Q1CSM2_HOLLE|nr:Zinc finger CCHC domain-containing protein 3 [Holothuria leucospilota]
MPGGRDSSIVKLQFVSRGSVTPKQVFCLLKENKVDIKDIQMLQALAARNTYDLKFRDDAARIKGVSSLKGVEGLTVTPYDRSVVVTVLYLNFEVEQGLVARFLRQYGTVFDSRWVTYNDGEMKGVLNGKRQFRMELDRDIPSVLFIGGSKAHIRYFGQPRTCFQCREEGHEAKSCPNKRCGRCLKLGHDKTCPNESGPEYSTQELEEAAQQVEQDFLASSKQCEEGPRSPETGSPSSSSPPPVEADAMTVQEDLHISSENESVSAMSDDGESASEPPAKDPPSGEGWFDFCEGLDPESPLKRSASGEVSDRPTPSPRSNKKARAQVDDA